MIMNGTFKRRVRIKGKPNEFNSFKIMVEDIETGEMIGNICKIVITLIPGGVNIVDFTYYEANAETGRLLLKDGQPIVKEIQLDSPEIDLDALERLQKERNT
jgi:hypothetical protein